MYCYILINYSYSVFDDSCCHVEVSLSCFVESNILDTFDSRKHSKDQQNVAATKEESDTS